MVKRIYAAGGINSTWYIIGQFDDVTMSCTLEVYDRLHNDRDRVQQYRLEQSPEYTKGGARLIEDSNRTIQLVQVYNPPQNYTVLNPGNVFKYGRFHD